MRPAGGGGAVWVFTLSGGVWTQQGSKLVFSAIEQGQSVALSANGNTAIVGAATGGGISVGEAGVFIRSGGIWTQQGSVLDCYLGYVKIGFAGIPQCSVSLSGDGNTAILGGPDWNGYGGAVLVFTLSGGVWTQQSELVGTGAVGAAGQGTSVALSADGSTLIVGGPRDNGGIGAAWVFVQPSPLLAAVLPESRSVQVNSTATAFATIINTGTTTAPGCSIAPASGPPATFVYQTTNPATNALTGTANTPVNIAGNNGSQSFVIAFTPSAVIAPINEALLFTCSNATTAPIVFGLNSLLLSASTSPTPDVVALAATIQNDGIVHVTGSPMKGAFAVATDNLGSGDTITVATNPGTATLPITVTLCQTNPTTGACMQTPSATVATTINSGDTPTFGIFVSASAAVAFDPANSRIFVTFTDSTNAVRGETSVAVETQ